MNLIDVITVFSPLYVIIIIWFLVRWALNSYIERIGAKRNGSP